MTSPRGAEARDHVDDVEELFSRPASISEPSRLLSPPHAPAALYNKSDAAKGHDEEHQDDGSIRSLKRKQQWEAAKQRTGYYIPILQWLPNYSLSLLSGDFVAALTLTCLLVPQGMSYASSLAHLSPVNGLFGVAVPSLVYVLSLTTAIIPLPSDIHSYAFLGTCPQLSLGPEAALSLMTGETIASIFAQVHGKNHMSDYDKSSFILGVASLICLQAGVVTFGLGVLRLGFLDAVLSRPLLRGFIGAVAVVIMVSQAIPMLGLSHLEEQMHADSGTTFQKILFLVENVQQAHLLTTCLSLCTLAFLVGARIVKPRLIIEKGITWVRYIPEVLIVVIVTTSLTAATRWDHQGLAIVGHVSVGHIHLHWPLEGIINYFQDTIGTAVMISIVGYVDSICAAKENASRFNFPISPNRELVALGVGNIAASVASGSLVGFGSITRSRLNANAGARSPMASLLTGIFVLLTMFFLLDHLYFLPKSTLACIVAMVVYTILLEVPEDLSYFWRMRAWTELALMAATFILTVFWSLKIGIVVSIALSLIMVVARSSTVSIKIMGREPGGLHWVPVTEDNDFDEEVPGVLVVRVRELTFANAGMLKEKLRRLERYGHRKHHPSDAPYREEAKVIVFHMADVDAIDASALQVLQEVIKNYTEHDVRCEFCHIGVELRRWFDRAGITDLVGYDAFHDSVNDALVHLASR